MGGHRSRRGRWNAVIRHLGIAAVALTLAATGASAAATHETTPDGVASFTDPEFGWAIAWDPADWTDAGKLFPSPSRSKLNLSPLPGDRGRSADVFFIPLEAYGGDPAACIADAPALINGWWPARPDYDVFAETAVPLLDAAGDPIGGETADAASAAYVLDVEGDGIDERDTIEALECRTLVPRRAVLLIRHNPTSGAADPAAFAAEAEAVGDLLEGLELPAATAADGTPAPAVGPADRTRSTRYEDDEFGFVVAYDPAAWWARSSSPASSNLMLTNGVSFVHLAGSATLPTDAPACVEETMAGLVPTSTRRDYAPLLDAAGDRVAGGDATAAFAVYTWQGRTEPIFEHLGCYALPNGRGVVTVVQNGPLAAYETEAAALATLLAGLGLDADRA